MTLWQRLMWLHATELGRKVFTEIRDRPEQWSSGDGYYLSCQPRFADVWIANRAYALKLRVWPERGIGLEIFLGWWDRHLIWSVVRPMRIPSPEVFERRRVLAYLTATNATS